MDAAGLIGRIHALARGFRPSTVLGWPVDVLTNRSRISLGRGVRIRAHARLEAIGPGRLVIGDRLHAEGYVTVSAADLVEIGHDVLLGAGVAIRDNDHGTAPGRHRGLQSLTTAPVRIGDYAWLGQYAVVTKGVTIGRDAVIGAHAVVTHDVPDGAIAAGVPARVIGSVYEPAAPPSPGAGT